MPFRHARARLSYHDRARSPILHIRFLPTSLRLRGSPKVYLPLPCSSSYRASKFDELESSIIASATIVPGLYSSVGRMRLMRLITLCAAPLFHLSAQDRTQHAPDLLNSREGILVRPHHVEDLVAPVGTL
jgi:hypothetical protein